MAKQPKLFPEQEQIVAKLADGEQQVLLVVFVPSHAQDEKPIPDQEFWANGAIDIMSKLYGGCTAFDTFGGGYWSDKQSKVLVDKPMTVESYAFREAAEDPQKLHQLLDFLKRMGSKTNQESIGLVVNHYFHNIDPKVRAR